MINKNKFIEFIQYACKIDKFFDPDEDIYFILNVLCCVINIKIAETDNPEKIRQELIEKISNMFFE